MRSLLQLAAILALTGVTITHAQITNPNTLVAPAPRNPAHTAPRDTPDLQWLWQYAKPSNKPSLLADPRFTTLLRDNLKAPQAMWGTGLTLSDAAQTFLAGEGTITETGNRYLTITGCVLDHCPQRGLLWIDLNERNPLIVFSALRWNEEGHTTDEQAATFTLWLFPNRALDPAQLPEALKQSLDKWTLGKGDCTARHISLAIVVDPDGTPHVNDSRNAGIYHCIDATSSGTHS
jgi:hypothetical protein